MISCKKILDVGCGTGSYTFFFARDHVVTGIDISEDMIKIANLKKHSSNSNVSFICMDMRKIKLSTKYDVATVLYGGWGYLLKNSDLNNFLESVRRVLNKDGILLFEFFHEPGMSKESKTLQGDHELKLWPIHDNVKLIRHKQIKFDVKKNILRYDYYFYETNITKHEVLKKQGPEIHLTRAFTIPEIQKILKKNGFTPLSFYRGNVGEKGFKIATKLDSRVFCVARVK